MRWLLLLTVFLAGCPPPGIYKVMQPGLTCARATRVAYRTMTQLGYTITEVDEPTLSKAGRIVGTKPGPDGRPRRGSVRISCHADRTELQPVEGQLVPDDYTFSRNFGYSFKALVQRPDEEIPSEQVGLQVLLERLDATKARLDLGGPAIGDDAVLLRITVRNHTGSALVLDAGRVSLVTENGDPVQALRGDAALARLSPDEAADQVRNRLLTRTLVPAGETVQRYLVFPVWPYADAQLAIEDMATGETEGFVVPVQ